MEKQHWAVTLQTSRTNSLSSLNSSPLHNSLQSAAQAGGLKSPTRPQPEVRPSPNTNTAAYEKLCQIIVIVSAELRKTGPDSYPGLKVQQRPAHWSRRNRAGTGSSQRTWTRPVFRWVGRLTSLMTSRALVVSCFITTVMWNSTPALKVSTDLKPARMNSERTSDTIQGNIKTWRLGDDYFTAYVETWVRFLQWPSETLEGILSVGFSWVLLIGSVLPAAEDLCWSFREDCWSNTVWCDEDARDQCLMNWCKVFSDGELCSLVRNPPWFPRLLSDAG